MHDSPGTTPAFLDGAEALPDDPWSLGVVIVDSPADPAAPAPCDTSDNCGETCPSACTGSSK